MINEVLQSLEEKGYCYIPSFLSQDYLSEINHFFDDNKNEFSPAKVSQQKQRVENIRGDFTYWLDPLSPVKPFEKIFDFLNKLKDEVNAHFYMGLKQYECHLAYYPPGTFYQKHYDRFETSSSRSLTFVFYVNKDWDEQSGGEIILYDKKGNVLDQFLPMPGSVIFFLSGEFPHEVKAAVKERRSLTGWMHNKIIY